ncbi:unnamed protein product [Eretmochelys imbricata]
MSLACMRDMDEAALRKDIGTLFPALHSMSRLFLVELLVFLFRRLDEDEETCARIFILDRIV